MPDIHNICDQLGQDDNNNEAFGDEHEEVEKEWLNDFLPVQNLVHTYSYIYLFSQEPLSSPAKK